MSELLKSRHAFGSEANIDSALDQGLIDAYDILFLNEGKIGWIDKDGNKVILEDKKQVVTVDALPEVGNVDTVYIYDSKFYFWNGKEFVTNADMSGISAEEVDAKIDSAVSDVMDKANAYVDEKVQIIDEIVEKVKFEVTSKPVGTLVNYGEKEIRVMCPSDTAWVKQSVGANGDGSKYYIGFKAYAHEGSESFKEGLNGVVDDEMLTFDGEFAGTDEFGRKYSIVWLPVAVLNDDNTWTYYGANSSAEKYVGWNYAVEWYNAEGVIVAADCIRINLTNEACHTSDEPYYVNNIVNQANAYTDEQIANAFCVVEF